MKRTARSNRAQKLVKGCAVVAGVGLVTLGFVSSVSAQTAANGQPLGAFPNAESNPDPFSNRGDQSSGVMSLIHRALQGQSKGAEEFNAEQQESLDSAAAQFRAKQQELLRSNSAVPVAPVVPAPASK